MRSKPQQTSAPDQSRRALLKLFPIGVALGVFGSLAAAAFRFLRPMVTTVTEDWIEVAAINEITGTTPVPKSIIAEQLAGWAASKNEHTVYVLPGKNEVLSAVCPHEGCEVMWEAESSRFSCPCHESFFGPDGAKLSGPARRGLDPLPTRVQDGKLQVQFRFFENNSQERITRT
jgi:menaquinol-cytochrome c reductase iron-sulfur subunit